MLRLDTIIFVGIFYSLMFFLLIWYYFLSQLKLQCPVSGCFCYHYFDLLDYQHNTNPNSPAMVFLNAPLLFLHSSKILPTLPFQILSKLAEILQRIFLQFFGYSVNYEMLLLASYVLYSHTNIRLIYLC